MTPDAVLITKPDVSWDTLFTLFQKFTGRALTKTVDVKKLNPRELRNFMIELAEFKTNTFNPDSILRNPGNISDHISLSFLIICDNELRIQLSENFKILSTETKDRSLLCIVSGSLTEWRSGVINCCSDLATYNLRLLFDKIYIQLDQLGLGLLWSEYRKKTLPDKTFYLEG